jgi:hypothetical protein
MRLTLDQEWDLDEPIGSGGFGRVYAAGSPQVPHAVAKLVPKEPGAEREMLFVDLGGARNVVPIIDSGETDDSWVLVMPRAEKSLREHLEESGGSLPVADAVAILTDMATALTDLAGRVVHRDLKPENVLLLDGQWCLADFGISRYAEATTAPDTRKYALTPAYAAPERWRDQRATSATDIYALGIMAYELISGTKPFAGPDISDYREQHLHDSPKPLDAARVALAALIEECLYKAPEARPSASNLLARFARAAQSASSGGLAQLQAANRAEVARRGEDARLASASRSEAERRAQLVESARNGLTRMGDALKDAILQAAPAVTVKARGDGGWQLTLHQAELGLTAVSSTPSAPWGGWQPPAFDVIAHASISLTVPRTYQGYVGRSHSLWYCDAREAGTYQWFETAFMLSAFSQSSPERDPFARAPGIEAAKALWNGIAEYQVAWPFTPLIVDDLDGFVDRWSGWFAAGAQGQLHHPMVMPERPPHETWRR